MQIDLISAKKPLAQALSTLAWRVNQEQQAAIGRVLCHIEYILLVQSVFSGLTLLSLAPKYNNVKYIFRSDILHILLCKTQ